MPVDFFAVPCINPAGNCQTQAVNCLQSITQTEFGISDANSDNRTPAVVMLANSADWDFKILNPNQKVVRYKAVDYCVEIYRTGTYDVKDNESDINDFSSDNISTAARPELIKRCEGMILEQNMGILFFEIKVRTTGNWLVDARRKFEETILSFMEHHPEMVDQIVEPVVSNKAFSTFRVHQNLAFQNRILKDKIGKELRVATEVTIE